MKTQTHLNRWFGVLGCLLLASGVYAQETSSKFLPVYNSSTGKMEEIEINENLTEIAGFEPQSETETVMEKGVIGREDWYQVDGLKYPYSASVALFVSGQPWCSAALIGPYTILTNAHCVYKDPSHNDGTLLNPSTITAYAGGTRYGVKAKGTRIYAASGTERIRNFNASTVTADYAIIVLDKPLGNKNGYFGVKLGQIHRRDSIFLLGFPGIKSHDRPWLSPGAITGIHAGYFCHNADEVSGSSGSPVFKSNDLNNIVGINSFDSATYRGSRRTSTCNGAITHTRDALVNFVKRYRMERPTQAELPDPQRQREEFFNRLQSWMGGRGLSQFPDQTQSPETGNSSSNDSRHNEFMQNFQQNLQNRGRTFQNGQNSPGKIRRFMRLPQKTRTSTDAVAL